MGGCGNCGGDCGNCSGCGGALTINEGEMALLMELGQYAFLPVARRADDPTPLYCGEMVYSREEYSLILQCLEKKGLITLDYEMPLKGFSDYGNFPLRGSCSLTLRGQQVLDLLQIQGVC